MSRSGSIVGPFVAVLGFVAVVGPWAVRNTRLQHTLTVVDTMGVRGGKIHSMEEFLITESLSERAALSALTILRLAEGR